MTEQGAGPEGDAIPATALPVGSQEHPRTGGQSTADLTHSCRQPEPTLLDGFLLQPHYSLSNPSPGEQLTHPPATLGKGLHPEVQGVLARLWPKACSGYSPFSPTSQSPLCSAITSSHQSSFALTGQNIISGEKRKGHPTAACAAPCA